MSNFVKVSQLNINQPTQTQRAQESLSAERRQQELASRLRSGDSVSRVVENAMNLANLQGSAAERFEKEILDRAALVRLMLVETDEETIARYFNEFLFVKPISYAKTFEIMNMAVRGSRLPLVDLTEALDFALNHYDVNGNISLTLEIMNEVNELQPTLPELKLYPILNEALRGNYSPVSLVELSEKNIEKYRTILSLISLALSKPEEDITSMMIKFRRNKDSLERLREIDDRYKAIFSALLDDEFNRAMQRTVKLLTEVFKMSVNDPTILAVRRIFQALKMGESARKQFFSDIAQTPIANQPSPVSQQVVPARFFSKSNVDENGQNIRLAQAESKITPISTENAQFLIEYLSTLIKFVNKLSSDYSSPSVKNKIKPQDLQRYNIHLQIFKDSVNKFNELRTKIVRGQISAEVFNREFQSQFAKLYNLP